MEQGGNLNLVSAESIGENKWQGFEGQFASCDNATGPSKLGILLEQFDRR